MSGVAIFDYKRAHSVMGPARIEYVALQYLNGAIMFTKADGSKRIVPYTNVETSIELIESKKVE